MRETSDAYQSLDNNSLVSQQMKRVFRIVSGEAVIKHLLPSASFILHNKTGTSNVINARP